MIAARVRTSLFAAMLLIAIGNQVAVAQLASPDVPLGRLGFRDATKESGLAFQHFNGMIGEKYIVEVIGSGCALFDYDNDGDLDAYLVQGASLEEDGSLDAALFPPAVRDTPPRDRLFRNDLTTNDDGTTSIRFVDVTNESGIDARGYGMAATAGDYDGDGYTDLFISNFGPDQLWRNNGDGTFVDATAAAGLDAGGAGWSLTATFFDADGDRDLDLFVARYVAWSRDVHKRCEWFGGRNDYCGPLDFQPLTDQLWLNDGTGRFRDASDECGIGGATGTGLGTIVGDWNGDGLPDIFVANDAMPNFLWENQGPRDGEPGAPPVFVESGFDYGVAVGAEGYPEGSMGVAPGDQDGDGDEDILLTHFTLQKNTFYRNFGGMFGDQTPSVGLDWVSRPWTGFGVGWMEIDGDGWLDLFVANGAVHALEDRVKAGDAFPLGQRNQLFRTNPATRRIEEATGPIGRDAFDPLEVSRGAAFGDIDNDGDTDILVSNNNGPARLIVNEMMERRRESGAEAGEPARWIGFEAVGADAGLGNIRVELDLSDGRTLVRWMRRDGSYACSGDPRVLFHWPAGVEPTDFRIVSVIGGEELQSPFHFDPAGFVAMIGRYNPHLIGEFVAGESEAGGD